MVGVAAESSSSETVGTVRILERAAE